MSIFSDLLNDSNSLYTPITTSWSTTPAQATKMSITAVVLKDGEPIHSANISVNGIAKIRTDDNGFFSINVLSTDIIKVTSVGYADFEAKASDFPTAVDMLTKAEVLKGVVITAAKKPKPEPKTNWLLWLGIGTVGFLAYQKYGAKAPIKAKL